MPLPKSRERTDLAEVGAEEFYVEWRTMGGLPYKDMREMYGEGESDDEDSVKSMFQKLIIDWNIPEVDGGEPLPIPSENPDSVDKLPTSFVNFIASKMAESSGLGTVDDLVSQTDNP